MKFIYSLMLFTFLMSTFAPVESTAYNCERKLNQIQSIDLNRACQKPDSKDCISAKSAYADYKANCSTTTSTTKSAPIVAAPAPVKSSTTKTSTAPKSTTTKSKSTATPPKEETSAQQVNVPNTNSIYCNDTSYKSGSCYCNSNEKKETVSANTLNATVSKCVMASSGNKNPISPKFDVESCLSGIKYYVDACRDDAEKAVSSCDPEQQAESNSDAAFDMKNIFNAANSMALKKGAGSGAYETCLQTALITQAGYYTTDQLKQVCEPQVDQCKKSCDTAKKSILENQDEVYLNCKRQAQEADPSLSDNEFESQYGNGIANQFKDLIALSNESSQACEKDAEDYKAQIAQASNDFNNAAKQAQICRCQTGSTGEDCSVIQGPAQCALNPNAVGCAMSTINCNNSDSLQCRCIRNPNLAECKSTNGGPSVFASVNGGFKPTTSNGGSPKISNEDFDISFDEESSLAAVSGTPGGATSPFGSSQASGGGGGGGSGAGGGGADDPAVAGAEGESSFKPLLDKPKGLLGGLLNKLGFGGGDAGQKKYKTDANGKKIDPSKWKPGMLRGVAGDGSEIGPKHRDIWKQMNSQYFLQEKTFLQEK